MKKIDKAERWIDDNTSWIMARVVFILIVVAILFPAFISLILAYVGLVGGIMVWLLINNK